MVYGNGLLQVVQEVGSLVGGVGLRHLDNADVHLLLVLNERELRRSKLTRGLQVVSLGTALPHFNQVLRRHLAVLAQSLLQDVASRWVLSRVARFESSCFHDGREGLSLIHLPELSELPPVAALVHLDQLLDVHVLMRVLLADALFL